MNALQQFLQAASNEAAGTISGPVDLIGMGLRKLGVPVPRNALMSSEWMKQNGLMQDVPQNAASLAGQTFGLLSPVAAAAKAPQIARGLLQMGENAAAPRMLNPQAGAIVWQGSPHKYEPEKLVQLPDGRQAYVGGNFNALKEPPPGSKVLEDFPLGRIRSEAIGTGEGAQAYGHGSYLAEAQDVARGYQVKLSGGSSVVDGRGVPVDPTSTTADLEKALRSAGLGWDEAERAATGWSSAVFNGKTSELHPVVQKELAARGLTAKMDGSLYKVDLPDEKIARMLDWDKPLSQQSEAVQKAMAHKPASYAGPEYTADELINAMMEGRQLPSRQVVTQEQASPLSQALGMFREKSASTKPPTGEQVYRALADQYGHDKAAKMMREAGIPGIRYLDGGSRSAGAGSSNFVVFPGEENALKILERNGKPIR